MEKEKLIKISENDWHYKLIKYTWGVNPRLFKNLCPYFWLTLASLFCCPFVIVWKSLKKIWKVFYDFDQVNYTRRLSKEQIYYQYYYLKHGYSAAGIGIDPKYFSAVREKIKKYSSPEDFLKEFGLSEKKVLGFKPSFEKKLDQERDNFVKKQSKEYENKRKSEERNRKIKESMYKVADTCKFFVKAIGVLFCCLLGNMFCWIISNLICWGAYTGIGVDILLYLVYGVIAFLAIFVFTWFSGKFETDWKENFKNLTTLEYLYVIPFLIIYIPLRIIFVSILWKIIYYGLYRFLWGIVILGILTGFKEGIVEFTGIFGNYLNASYSDYCPMISWDKNEEEEN